jgi:hypothetical protein
MFVPAVIKHHTRRIRVLDAAAHPTASWVSQAARDLVMDLQDAGCRARFLNIRRPQRLGGILNAYEHAA